MTQQNNPQDFNVDGVDLCKGCGAMKHVNKDGVCGRCVKGQNNPTHAKLEEV